MLFCFPYAGGNASLFRAWVDALPGDLDVYGIQLPGRANRIRQRPYTQLGPAVREITHALETIIDRPFALYGHSLGAILAFEVARAARRRFGLVPTRLLVSGRRAPQVPDTDPPRHNDGADEFIAHLRELNGTPSEILDNQEMVALMLPTLRADFQLAETYQCEPDAPLRCPITAFGGTRDEESEDGRLDAWRAQTSADLTCHMFEGDHFFIHSSEHEFLGSLSSELLRGLQRSDPVAL